MQRLLQRHERKRQSEFDQRWQRPLVCWVHEVQLLQWELVYLVEVELLAMWSAGHLRWWEMTGVLVAERGTLVRKKRKEKSENNYNWCRSLEPPMCSWQERECEKKCPLSLWLDLTCDGETREKASNAFTGHSHRCHSNFMTLATKRQVRGRRGKRRRRGRACKSLPIIWAKNNLDTYCSHTYEYKQLAFGFLTLSSGSIIVEFTVNYGCLKGVSQKITTCIKRKRKLSGHLFSLRVAKCIGPRKDWEWRGNRKRERPAGRKTRPREERKKKEREREHRLTQFLVENENEAGG